TRENRRGTPRGASGFAAARSLTTAERGGEPPPGTARYSRLERRFPLLKQGAIWVEPWSYMLHPFCKRGMEHFLFAFLCNCKRSVQL
ncbi:hypothetical protein AAAT52_14640, partial [Gemmiger formicilis]|uniref:hypothetical protein n=1 Tax=Gemmiger formicilis TaxID=745368 RepID=UPI0032BFBB57